MLIIIIFIAGVGVGETKDASNKSYSLGYAECKASMPHRYLNETKDKQ